MRRAFFAALIALVSGSADTVVPAFQGDVQFKMSVKRSGTTIDVPIDLAGWNYIAPRNGPMQHTDSSQNVASINFNGELAQGWAGPIAMAFGVLGAQPGSAAELGPLEVFTGVSRFPNRVNAGFLQVVSRGQVRLRVYERGAGETLACGTGACAAVVAGIRLGWLDG